VATLNRRELLVGLMAIFCLKSKPRKMLFFAQKKLGYAIIDRKLLGKKELKLALKVYCSMCGYSKCKCLPIKNIIYETI
jgi:hypothetical protein